MHEGRVKKVLGNTDSVLSLAVNPTLSYYMYVTTHVQGVPLCLMVDTGAAGNSSQERQVAIVRWSKQVQA